MTDNSIQIMRGIIEFGDLPQEGLQANYRLVRAHAPKFINPADGVVLRFIERFTSEHEGHLPTYKTLYAHYDGLDRLDLTVRLRDYEALTSTSDGSHYAWLVDEHVEFYQRLEMKSKAENFIRILDASGPVELGSPPHTTVHDPGAASALKYLQSVDWASIAKAANDEAPIPFQVSGDIHPFPISVFPGRVPEYVQAVARATDMPVDMVAVCCLQALSVACQHYLWVEEGSRSPEPAIVWTMVIAPPGSRKNAVYNEMMRPVWNYAREERDLYRTRLAAATQALEAAKASNAEPDRIRELQEAVDDVPRPNTVTAGDATPEVLIRKLNDYPSLCLAHADSNLLGQLCGRYKKQSDLTIALNGYDGQNLQYDRVGNGKSPISFHVEHARLGLFCLTQQESLEELNSPRNGYRAKGTNGRISIYVLPPKTEASQNIDLPPVPDDLRAEYDRLMDALLRGGAPDEAAVTNSDDLMDGDLGLDDIEPEPALEQVTIRPRCLDATAEGHTHSWFHQVRVEEEESKVIGSELAHIVDWCSKWSGRMLRMAGILEHARDTIGDRRPFNAGDLIELAGFYLQHASHAFGQPESTPPQMMVAGDLHNKIVEKLDEYAAKHGRKFKARAGYRTVQHIVSNMSRFREILELLEGYGWCSLSIDHRKGRPSDVVEWHGKGAAA